MSKAVIDDVVKVQELPGSPLDSKSTVSPVGKTYSVIATPPPNNQDVHQCIKNT
ncbi:hypothetical protein LOY67_02345 [Pseudomonas sp. B21-056]|jgi:hypothetical protein|nr:hypothetical protein LOY67_02345 [Pseudomonas sp. B21-056]